METTETFNQYYSLGDETYSDFIHRPLEEIVNERFERIGNDLVGKHFYSLNVTKIPTRINYHQFTFEKLQEISRKLTNGLSTIGSIPNRKFWNRYFIGGVRTISVIQHENNEYPSFTLNYIIYSEIDNLDIRIKSQLFSRIKMIDPTLVSSFSYIGRFGESTIKDHLDYSTNIDLSTQNLMKLGENTIDDIYNNKFQRPRFFGKLFKIKNQYETINN